MIKAGIFLDLDNLLRNGGWGLRFNAIKKLVEAQGGTVLRANAYMAIDTRRESEDPEYSRKKNEYRSGIRRQGFYVDLKRIKRYVDDEGQVVLKGNMDLELAVDALLQSDNLDYILLGSGDGDFLKLVQALQSRGKRVDILSFSNTSNDLKKQADYYFNGYLYPWLLPREQSGRMRGFLHKVLEEDGYGFLTVQTGLGFEDVRQDIFLHINDITAPDGSRFSNEQFARLKTDQAIVEFELLEDKEGKSKAREAVALGDDQLMARND